jgi:hypothetical protein
MKKIYFSTLFIFCCQLFFTTNSFAQKRKNRYISPFEVRSSVSPIFRVSRRSIRLEIKDLNIPLTDKKINLLLNNQRQNATFDMLAKVEARAYAFNASYSAGAGYFDKHILTKIIRAKKGDFLGLLDKTNTNHSIEIGINALGIRQLFKRVPRQDFQWNASVNYVLSFDLSDRLDMGEYIDVFEYQKLPEFIIRNKKYFEQVQDFIIEKYSLPNMPFYKGISANISLSYGRFQVFGQHSFTQNILNSKVNSFYFGGRFYFN